MKPKSVNESSDQNPSTGEGNFSAVPHEMSEILMRLDLTARENRICWFLVREIQGYQLKEKIIKTSKFIQSTGLPKQHLSSSLNSLMKKGVVERDSIQGQRGEYLYRFSEKRFGRTHATKEVKNRYFEGGKVIHISDFKSPNRLPDSNQNGDHEVTDSVTMKTQKPATVAASRDSKDTLNISKNILREEEVDLNCQNGNGNQNSENIDKGDKLGLSTIGIMKLRDLASSIFSEEDHLKKKEAHRASVMQQFDAMRAGLI